RSPMADEIDRKLLDKRVAHRYVKKGVLDEKDWEKHMKSLPDLAEQAMPVESDLDDDDLDDLDEEDDDEVEEAAAPSSEEKES
ncbi:MAG: RNA polymerase subunit sigma, partial [Anaeromyxobacteraceae bacterium]